MTELRTDLAFTALLELYQFFPWHIMNACAKWRRRLLSERCRKSGMLGTHSRQDTS